MAPSTAGAARLGSRPSRHRSSCRNSDRGPESATLDGTDHTGSPIRPRFPLVNQTRLLALPGSTATTSAVSGTTRRNSSVTSHLPPTARDPPTKGGSLRTGDSGAISYQRSEARDFR
jgi:hypothetical protein